MMNHHCCALEISGKGILIEGASGSGKTSLMMGLLEKAKLENVDASFICDDQAILNVQDDVLIANAPKAIAGKLELHGYGIIDSANISSTRISLVVRILPDETIERMPDDKFTLVCDIRLPLIETPARHEKQAIRIVWAKLTSI